MPEQGLAGLTELNGENAFFMQNNCYHQSKQPQLQAFPE